MQWTEQEPQLPLQDISALWRRLQKTQGLVPPGQDITVFAPSGLRTRVWQHLKDSDIEQGGLLLGEVLNRPFPIHIFSNFCRRFSGIVFVGKIGVGLPKKV